MRWRFDKDRPIYSQIIEHIKLFIVSGQLPAGAKISSVRELAAEAGVNPNTMQRALSELERMGLVYSNRTSGRFITVEASVIADAKDELARESISAFLENMNNIGYTKDETIKMIEDFRMEVCDDE